MAQLKSLLDDMNIQMHKVQTHMTTLSHRVSNGTVRTDGGISFLEVKNHLLLSYLINLVYLMLRKVNGKSIHRDSCIERIVEIRTFLEKMRPIDQKLKYQIDKLIKTAVTGVPGEDDPLRFRPNPANMVSKLDDDGDDDQAQDGAERDDKTADDDNKLYRPPKITPMHYDDDDNPADKASKTAERARKRALNSNIIKELKEQYDDAPEEMKGDGVVQQTQHHKSDKERESYEEKYFTRLPVTRQQKHSQRHQLTDSGLSQITKFRNISALTGRQDSSDDESMKPSKKKKITKKMKKKMAKKMKKRHR